MPFQKWNRNGPDAVYIVRGFEQGEILPGPEGFQDFIHNHKDWNDRYPRRNLRTNFVKAVQRWQDFKTTGTGKESCKR